MIMPVVEHVFPVEVADDVYELIAANQTFGKVVLNVRD